MMGITAAIVGFLLLVSALLTGSLEAVSRLASSNLRTLQDEGFAGAAALAAIREDEDAARVGVRLLTMVCDLGAVGLIAVTGVSTGGFANPLVSTGLGVVLVIFVAELVPHAIASRRPVRIALSSAPFLLRVTRLSRPVAVRLARLEDGLARGDEARTTEHRELMEIQEIGEEEGVLEEAENRLVERAFRLDESTAWDVMTPRVDIFAWPEDLMIEDVVATLGDVPFSRVPVYRESVDDVTGIVYVREVYERFSRGDRGIPIASLAREAYFVPGSLSLTQLLHSFQARRIHMGIIADEFGGTDGLVTLEDILEELVGEIHDETDPEEEEIVRVGDDTVECDASVDVREIGEALGISLPKAEHRSLNGLILEELGHVPPVGESFERSGVRFDIMEATETQVLKARLTRLATVED